MWQSMLEEKDIRRLPHHCTFFRTREPFKYRPIQDLIDRQLILFSGFKIRKRLLHPSVI